MEQEVTQEEQLFNELAPQVIGHHSLVGARLIGMSSSQGEHTMTFDNGVRAHFSGTVKLERVGPEDEETKELTATSVHEHFKSLEPGDDSTG